eukprot:scaffold3886_cov399-Prasinococcus_capsulatus_cf.AAC.42
MATPASATAKVAHDTQAALSAAREYTRYACTCQPSGGVTSMSEAFAYLHQTQALSPAHPELSWERPPAE